MKFKVRVGCITFNHAPYIKQTLEGFCRQETNFPFVCTIIDDASTDGEQNVISNYLEEHFELGNDSNVKKIETGDYIQIFAQHNVNKNCFFLVLLLKYNHYVLNKSKIQYISELRNSVEYTAICEGDDYWTDSRKLQLQVDFLEKHKECSMTCCRAKLYSVRDKIFAGDYYCHNFNGYLNPVDVINRTGLYINTCSIVYRQSVIENYPEYCSKCKIGDYPLQIMGAMKGKIYYFNDAMCVYRICNPTSWMGSQITGRFDRKRLDIIDSKIRMFEGFASSFPRYKKIFNDIIRYEINCNVPNWKADKEEVLKYLNYYSKEIEYYTIGWKVDLIIRKCKIPLVAWIYSRLVMNRFHPKRKYSVLYIICVVKTKFHNIFHRRVKRFGV